MIKSTNTVNIDGTIIDHNDIINSFTFDKTDKFSRWVLRPVALLTAIGMGVAAFFASAFLIILSLAMLPLLAISMWAFKAKFERELATTEPDTNVQK